LRLVLPDFEEIARSYLSLRDMGDDESADFLVLALIDQYVRCVPGGELGRFYHELGSNTSISELSRYVRERTGQKLCFPFARLRQSKDFFAPKNPLKYISLIRSKLERIWIHSVVLLLPKPFREQNVSMAGIGERHHWIWDFYQLKKSLLISGFDVVERRTSTSSALDDFPFYPLDLDDQGMNRKGSESMYVEASKSFSL
jgi:hypothetical protein